MLLWVVSADCSAPFFKTDFFLKQLLYEHYQCVIRFGSRVRTICKGCQQTKKVAASMEELGLN